MKTAEASSTIYLDRDWNGALLTPKEFDDIEEYDERYRYELIHGVVVVSPLPSNRESDPNQTLGHWLLTYQETHPKGGVIDKTLPQQYVRIPKSRRIADRVIWCGLGRMPESEDLPTIVIEFVSRRRRDHERDYKVKKKEYMKLGIPEYWIIDRFRRTMTVVTKIAGKVHEKTVKEGEAYRPSRLPGFELPLKKLLAIADAWSR
ncbi:MAG: Uma2 family endonuclease [Gemmataceae bacterium]